MIHRLESYNSSVADNMLPNGFLGAFINASSEFLVTKGYVDEGLLAGLENIVTRGNDYFGVPQAYINYILFDKEYNVVEGKKLQISEYGKLEVGATELGDHEPLHIPAIPITKEGYIYIYLNNQTREVKCWYEHIGPAEKQLNKSKIYLKNKKILIIAIISILFFQCSLEKKRYNMLLRSENMMFYHEIGTSLRFFQYGVGREPESIDEVIKFFEEKHGDEDVYLWLTYFKDDLRLLRDCNEGVLNIYYIGPDGIDDGLETPISITEFNFRTYKNLKGDIMLISKELMSECD